MDPVRVHADRSRLAVVQSDELPWLPSPEPGVERRLLERSGGEVALASTLVRYAAGSRFRTHMHELGEEFLVLAGTFSDEHGDYPAGTYVRNPPGTQHAPFSQSGCLLFVKLRQMATDDRDAVRLRPEDLTWTTDVAIGLRQALLWSRGAACVTLVQIPPGATRHSREIRGGEEWLVVEGQVMRHRDGHGEPASLRTGAWVRDPSPMAARLTSESGALLWIQQGHLPAPTSTDNDA